MSTEPQFATLSTAPAAQKVIGFTNETAGDIALEITQYVEAYPGWFVAYIAYQVQGNPLAESGFAFEHFALVTFEERPT